MPLQYVTIGAIVLAFVVAAFAVHLAHGAVHRVLDRMEGGSIGNRAALHERAKKLVRTVMLLAYGIAALASISLALSWLGVGGLQSDPRLLGRWLITHGVNALLIIVGATIVMRAANLAIERLQHRLGAGRSQTDLEWQLRNWHYFHWLSGDYMMEISVHSVDKIAWVMRDEAPVKCQATGGRWQQKLGDIWDQFDITYTWANGAIASWRRTLSDSA